MGIIRRKRKDVRKDTPPQLPADQPAHENASAPVPGTTTPITAKDKIGLQKDVSSIFTGTHIPKPNPADETHGSAEAGPAHLVPPNPQVIPAAKEPSITGPETGTNQDSGTMGPTQVPAGIARFSTIQKALIIALVVSIALLLYSLSLSPSKSIANSAVPPAHRPQPSSQPTPPQQPESAAPQLNRQQTQTPSQPNEALSLQLADELYLKKDYDKAFAAYSRLRLALTSPDDELLNDFLQLKMALCMEAKPDLDQADQLFRAAAESRSPVLRTIANYHCCLLEMNNGEFLKARTRACRAIATIQSLTFDWQWALSLERDCHFLAAEAVTRNVLFLCDADKDLPPKLWHHRPQDDPFIGISESELRAVLTEGCRQMAKGTLSPQISPVEQQGNIPQWSVLCSGPSIEELLSRFAANASLDLRWGGNNTPAQTEAVRTRLGEGKDGAAEAIETPSRSRRRAVTLYMPAATARQAVSTAAGSVGLLARFDDKATVEILDPAEYSSLSEHTSMLIDHAVALWQQLLLMYSDDQRLPNAHFALALLQVQQGRLTEAVAEYKLIANRFSLTNLALFALLHSSRLKTTIRDYPGARDDLKQLIEQYPDSDIVGQAHLNLAEITARAELFGEAANLYRKVYNLGPSSHAKTAAALGAGKCFYKIKNYQEAAKWLTQYIDLAKGKYPERLWRAQSSRFTEGESNLETGSDLYSAYFMLGEANLALGNLPAACDSFKQVLAGAVPKEKYVDALCALVETQIEQDNLVEALAALQNIHHWSFSQDESTRLLVLKAKVLRNMGLIDQAVTTLGDRAQYITDPQLKATVSFELAKCSIAAGGLELARKILADELVSIEPGPLAQQFALELADLCLKLDRDSQTVSICTQLLDSTDRATAGYAPTSSPQVKHRALELLATAHNKQKNYDRAALALLGRWNDAHLINTGYNESETESKAYSPTAK
jgi:tetratricopeptide (TPR) repeat protein